MSLKRDMPFETYLAYPAASASTLHKIRTQCPGAALYAKQHPKAQTDATLLGTAAHCFLLTPDLWEQKYVVKPEGMSFTTKEGKAWRDAPERAGKDILPWDVGQACLAIAAQWHNNDILHAIKPVAKEASIFWDACDAACKGRPDLFDNQWVYDVKITRDASPSRIQFAAWRNGWMHQLAWYRWGLNENGCDIKGGRLIAFDPEPPHAIVLAEARDSALDICALENERALEVYAKCMKSGEWPWWDDAWIKLEVPSYALDDVKIAEFNEEI